MNWNNFFIFNLFQIISACRFRNTCARLIFIELLINKISLHSFFLSFLSLYKFVCADAKMTLLVYYENDFSDVLWNIHSLIIRWQRKFHWDLMFAFCMRYICFTCSLRSHVIFSTTINAIVICFLFSGDYVPNLLTFFKRVNVRDARWYYDYHFIFKFFSSFSSHHDQTILSSFDFWKRSADCTSLYNRKFNRKWYYFFFCCSRACFYAIMNYESDLTDFSYNPQFF